MNNIMFLTLYNTKTKQKEIFNPLDANQVGVYACGPTVYDYMHVGNGRMIIVFDILFRVLRYIYGDDHVKYVRNITDIDDKIINVAQRDNINVFELTGNMIKLFHEDESALGCLSPSVEPRVTSHIEDIIEFIKKLLDNKNAYISENHVLFDVNSMSDYGSLSNRSVDEMIAGSRIEIASYKKSPMDFVLWKPCKYDEIGFRSPWGKGLPGWHIECSAMSWRHLGEVFDIHGGGIDLVFPHHENEVAQTRCAFGHEVMAKIWMHNGHLQVEGEKMSKSLGNFVTIHELLHTDTFGGRAWPGEVLRLAMLKTQYRQPIDFTVKALEEAERKLDYWYDLIENIDIMDIDPPHEFMTILGNDLNTPLALSYIDSLFLSKNNNNLKLALASSRLLGLMRCNSIEWEKKKLALLNITIEEINSYILLRNLARENKNWSCADKIRDDLALKGIMLMDITVSSTKWKVNRF